ARAAAQHHRRSRARARAPARDGGRLRRGRAGRGHHHARSQGAPALLRAARGRLSSSPEERMTPESVYLPFNRDCLRGTFTPAKRGTTPPDARGHWLIVQDQNLLVVADKDTP